MKNLMPFFQEYTKIERTNNQNILDIKNQIYLKK